MADMILFVRSSMAVAAACTALAAPSAHARMTKFEITTKESPTFGGYSWPGVGQYEKIAGKAYDEVNPKDPKNALIVDIKAGAQECARQCRVRVRQFRIVQ